MRPLVAGNNPADEHRAEERIGKAQIQGKATHTAAASHSRLLQAPLWHYAEPQRTAAPERRPWRTAHLGRRTFLFLGDSVLAYAVAPWPSDLLAMLRAPCRVFLSRQTTSADTIKAHLRSHNAAVPSRRQRGAPGRSGTRRLLRRN